MRWLIIKALKCYACQDFPPDDSCEEKCPYYMSDNDNATLIEAGIDTLEKLCDAAAEELRYLK